MADYLANSKGATGKTFSSQMQENAGKGLCQIRGCERFDSAEMTRQECGRPGYSKVNRVELNEARRLNLEHCCARGRAHSYCEAINFSHKLSFSRTLRRNSVSPAFDEGVESGSIGSRMLKVVPR